MINLFNEQDIKLVFKYIEDNKDRVELNEKLFDIYEGEIGALLDAKMKADLGESSYEQAKERRTPINILVRIIDKLSKIYQQDPVRQVVGDNVTENDKLILDKFEEFLEINQKLNTHNEFWNLFYYGLLQIGNSYDKAEDEGGPFVRTIPNHKYLIMNDSDYDPTSDDIVILFMDQVYDEETKAWLDVYWFYTDDQFAIYDSRQRLRTDLMAELEQDGKNPVSKKPFAYLNKSSNLVMSKIQNDTLDMSLLVPLLLSDTSYIAKFTTYSIMYGVDIDDTEMKISPNVFWSFKSDSRSDKNPSVGTVKPEGDIDKLLNLALTDLELWLNSKGIKPGSIGTVTSNNIASGISKLIDEADVTEIRNYQATLYAAFERDFWDLLLKVYYPFWVEQGMIENMGTFSQDAHVQVTFPKQTPMTSRNEIIEMVKLELESGFTTKRRALKTLNPGMRDEEIDELLAEIEEEEKILVPVNDPMNENDPTNEGDDEDEDDDKEPNGDEANS